MRDLAFASRAVKQRLEALENGLEASLETDPEGLHKARVATRRVREALPLVAPPHTLNPLSDFRHEVRIATRALGGVREMDVALTLVDEVRTEEPDLEHALDLVRTALTEQRQARVERMRRDLDAGRLRHESKSVAEHLDEFAGDARPTEQLALRLTARITAIRRAVAEAGLLYAPERLHRIRLAAKKLRYALELAGDMRVASTKRLVTEIKRMQERLGLLHDLETVARVARQALGQPDAPDAAPRTLAVLEARIRAQHADYLVHRDRFLEVIDRATAVRDRVRHRRSSRPSPVVAAGRHAGPSRGRPRPGHARS
jgi:CHAD domain-containing protein